MNVLAVIHRYLALGLVTALLLALAWAARVDHLRAGYQRTLHGILVSIDLTTGGKVNAATAPAARPRSRGSRRSSTGSTASRPSCRTSSLSLTPRARR